MTLAAGEMRASADVMSRKFSQPETTKRVTYRGKHMSDAVDEGCRRVHSY
jgi:hypothetical protein